MRRFTVPGWPARIQGHSAVVPHMNRLAGSGAQSYKDGVTGQPGTVPVPLPAPLVAQDEVSRAMSGSSRSSDAPAWFRPNLYWARPEASFWPGAGMPVALRTGNMMPVPAVDPRGVPAVTQTPFRIRGARQVKTAPVLISWPSS